MGKPRRKTISKLSKSQKKFVKECEQTLESLRHELLNCGTPMKEYWDTVDLSKKLGTQFGYGYQLHQKNPYGEKYEFKFGNGFGASVLGFNFRRDLERPIWELLVIDPNGEITYATPVASDILYNLSENDVAQYLTLIQKLEIKEGKAPYPKQVTG